MIAFLSGPEWIATFVAGMVFGAAGALCAVGLARLDRRGVRPDFDGSQRRHVERTNRGGTG